MKTVLVYVRAGLGRFNCRAIGYDFDFHANSLSVLRSQFFRNMVCDTLNAENIEFRMI